MIDCNFIKKYHPLYDSIEKDEPEYKSLRKDIRKEVLKKNELYIKTFTRVLNWKSARAKGKVDWSNFNKYIKTFKKLKNSNNEERLKLLISLDGIGIPTASVFLNLIWPNKYPIIDIRTVGILKYFGYINWTNISEKHYWEFVEKIMGIKNKCPKYSLREIDRALFYYHKEILTKKCCGKRI